MTISVATLMVFLGVIHVQSSLSRPVGGTVTVEVHLVPHSHCDAGWLITDEDHFRREVRVALDSIVASLSLLTNPTYRFVWAETIWLQKWIATSDNSSVQALRTLVQSGQIEIIGGGWTMNDESVAEYRDVIEMITTGHEFLRQQGLSIVRLGWQIDMLR